MVTKYLGVGFMGFGVLWLIIGGGMMLGSGPASPVADVARPFMILGASLLAVGALGFTVGQLQIRAARERTARIDAQGISARGTVSAVEPNWNVRVNGRAVYSIVAFTFTDSSGAPRSVRKTRVDSGLVSSSQIAAGAQVDVKYLMEDPGQCGLVLTDDMGQTRLLV